VVDEKRTNGIEFLSKLSGLSEEDVRQIAEDAKANVKTMRECPKPHDFHDSLTTKNQMVCRTCGSWTNSYNARWYMEGLEDGRRETP